MVATATRAPRQVEEQPVPTAIQDPANHPRGVPPSKRPKVATASNEAINKYVDVMGEHLRNKQTIERERLEHERQDAARGRIERAHERQAALARDRMAFMQAMLVRGMGVEEAMHMVQQLAPAAEQYEERMRADEHERARNVLLPLGIVVPPALWCRKLPG